MGDQPAGHAALGPTLAVAVAVHHPPDRVERQAARGKLGVCGGWHRWWGAAATLRGEAGQAGRHEVAIAQIRPLSAPSSWTVAMVSAYAPPRPPQPRISRASAGP
jgi:hypothetical protein